ncbi:MAG: aspartate carbamoyltransferase catalytic subunit [Flavobacteriaceae bacterium]|nr:aspartate carbamoyltransferase catalytic subunit [Flavobacteriaceae bacterium]
MLAIAHYSAKEIESLLHQAKTIADGKSYKAEKEIFVANLFFENSTRTKVSFEVAERKLRLNVIPFDVAQSSVNKGESLYDTVKTLQSIGVDLAVIRHSQNEYYKELENIDIAVINGGDGTGNHPSQTLLDLLTIQQEFGKFEGLKVAIVGDIKHSRVANSTSEALRKLGTEVYFSGPKEWFREGVSNEFYKDLDELIPEVDVLMLLRIQHERHESETSFSPQEYLEKFGLTKEREQKMKPKAIIMHPAPINRGVEIDSDLVECPRSRIFKQMQNGVFARMAILKQALENKGFKFKEITH